MHRTGGGSGCPKGLQVNADRPGLCPKRWLNALTGLYGVLGENDIHPVDPEGAPRKQGVGLW